MKNNYSAWVIKEEDFPKNGIIEEKIKFLLGYAILAPSTFNSQPWLCHINKNSIEVFLNHERVLKESDKTGRFAHVSMGAFLQNLILAANHFGLEADYKYKYEKQAKNTLLGIIYFTNKKVTDKTDLFESIKKRATNRSLSLQKQIPASILDSLVKQAKTGQKIVFFNKESKQLLSEISKKADIEIWSSITFRKEHVGWVRNNLTKEFDGMPAFGVGIKLIPSFFARPIILSPIFAKFQAKKNIASIKSSNTFVTICTDETTEDWIRLGMLFEEISLFLQDKGISISPMGQFIEDPRAQKELWELIKNKSKNKPQLFFRVGYPSQPVKHSPRIPVKDILL